MSNIKKELIGMSNEDKQLRALEIRRQRVAKCKAKRLSKLVRGTDIYIKLAEGNRNEL